MTAPFPAPAVQSPRGSAGSPAPPPQLPRVPEVRADPGPGTLISPLLPAPNSQPRRGLAPNCRGLCARLGAAAEPPGPQQPPARSPEHLGRLARERGSARARATSGAQAFTRKRTVGSARKTGSGFALMRSNGRSGRELVRSGEDTPPLRSDVSCLGRLRREDGPVKG